MFLAIYMNACGNVKTDNNTFLFYYEICEIASNTNQIQFKLEELSLDEELIGGKLRKYLNICVMEDIHTYSGVVQTISCK